VEPIGPTDDEGHRFAVRAPALDELGELGGRAVAAALVERNDGRSWAQCGAQPHRFGRTGLSSGVGAATAWLGFQFPELHLENIWKASHQIVPHGVCTRR